MSEKQTALQVVHQKIYTPDFTKALKAVLPQTANKDRWLALAWQASKTLKWKSNLDPNSVLVSLYEGAKLGLEFNPTMGEAYLVPFNCKMRLPSGQDTWRNICTFIPGYKGLIKLARRAGVKDIQARVVYSNDEFDYYVDENGPHIMWRPVAKNRGEPMWVISRAILEDGTYSIMDPLPWDKVESIKQQNLKRSKNTGPWKTHEEEMGQKTGIRRHCKVLPQEAMLAEALHLDEQAEELGNPHGMEVDDALDKIVDADYREMIEATESEDLEQASSKPEIEQPRARSTSKKQASQPTQQPAGQGPHQAPPQPEGAPEANEGDIWISPTTGREYHCIQAGVWNDSGIQHEVEKPQAPAQEAPQAPAGEEQDFQAMQQQQPGEAPQSAQEGEDPGPTEEPGQEALDLQQPPKKAPTQQQPAKAPAGDQPPVNPGLYASEILKLSSKLGWGAAQINEEVKNEFGHDNFMTVPVTEKVLVLQHFRELAAGK